MFTYELLEKDYQYHVDLCKIYLKRANDYKGKPHRIKSYARYKNLAKNHYNKAMEIHERIELFNPCKN